MAENIYDMSSRTRSKVIKRMKLGCFNCGWDKAHCDIHHIVPSSAGGLDSHDNLTVLCPNCHRLAHENKITKFVSFEEKIGDGWKAFSNVKGTPKKISLDGQRKSAATIKQKAETAALDMIKKVKESGIDVSKYGWVSKFSTLYGVKHQYVTRLIKKYDPSFYKLCFKK